LGRSRESLRARFEQAPYGVAIVLGLTALWIQLMAMRLPFADPASAEPVAKTRQPRDSVVVAKSHQGFGKRKTPA
jgi:hypothetical protein